ncbi:putative DNA-binding protein (UPF0251 family) [Methanococcus voltae]|uniref:DUF134 domain-containing protein n=1 Tax=Methanococcus voltae TaxID=2188 RepID=UPI001AEB07CF|nr:putative DNA-binding protein (UPF0251 family) [Methanococcus voltae]
MKKNENNENKEIEKEQEENNTKADTKVDTKADEKKGRPKIPRLISEEPKFETFKPLGTPRFELETLKLTVEELESVRLVDYIGYAHEDAAASMGISRRVFWNILKSARQKISDALINGKMLQIGGGHYRLRNCGNTCGGGRCSYRVRQCNWKDRKDL